jgi:hypothetical protein
MNRQRGSLVQCALPIDAPNHPALLGDRTMLCEQKKNAKSPKDCALLGGILNTLKLKTTAKLSSKKTSLATV